MNLDDLKTDETTTTVNSDVDVQQNDISEDEKNTNETEKSDVQPEEPKVTKKTKQVTQPTIQETPEETQVDNNTVSPVLNLSPEQLEFLLGQLNVDSQASLNKLIESGGALKALQHTCKDNIKLLTEDHKKEFVNMLFKSSLKTLLLEKANEV